MEPYHIKIIETALVVVVTILGKRLFSNVFRRIATKFEYREQRFEVVNRIKDFIFHVTALAFILTIWSVSQNQILLFISSFLTIMGITLFAQWSLLSNMTAGVILFVYHPAKIGDTIHFIDKDYDIEGRISRIGLFFILIVNEDQEVVTIPNSLILQKMTKVNPRESNLSKNSSN